MSAELLRPPSHLSPADALALSQQAPDIIKSQASWNLPWPLSLFVNSDTPEKWTIYENLFFACLRTGDNASASACLEQLKLRFGPANERVMGLVGSYHEATADSEKDLETVLKSYELAITEKPTNMIVRKRHAALLKSMGKLDGAAAALVDLLEVSPTDAEAWSELSELYFAQGLFPQAIYAMEEVLVLMPNGWNLQARLGELLYITSTAESNDVAKLKGLTRAMKVYSRSIELCDDYLRGYYGLKLTTNDLKVLLPKISSKALSTGTDEDFSVPSLTIIQKLNELATSKLAEIIRRSSTKESGWQGYEESEIIAARALLDRDSASR